MTLHKIDREKLTEALDKLNAYDLPYVIEQAAENWLAMGWQPIETAPRDGTKIDLWVTRIFPNEKTPAERIADCFWGVPDSCFSKEKYPPQWVVVGNCYGDYCLDAVEEEGTTHDGKIFIVKATHWMPLPEPPTMIAKAGE